MAIAIIPIMGLESERPSALAVPEGILFIALDTAEVSKSANGVWEPLP